ncbi:MAG: twin-arginine translocase TatA/TatE family subunit [Candidatus Obscuribacterales bacterium]|nr:twin-arginine translocase TatA/TatE family subunit [Candidatus Obscuribacterales bacterium]
MLNSPVDIAIVAGVALLLFGPKKLPELGRALGQGIGNFKKALTDAQDQVSTAVSTSENSDKKEDLDAETGKKTETEIEIEAETETVKDKQVSG